MITGNLKEILVENRGITYTATACSCLYIDSSMQVVLPSNAILLILGLI